MRLQDIIDTRPGQVSLFSPPHGVADYTAWLQGKYTEAHYKDGEKTCLFGVAQMVHAIIQRPAVCEQRLTECTQRLVAIGPHAGSAAQFIESLALQEHKRVIVVDVIPW